MTWLGWANHCSIAIKQSCSYTEKTLTPLCLWIILLVNQDCDKNDIATYFHACNNLKTLKTQESKVYWSREAEQTAYNTKRSKCSEMHTHNFMLDTLFSKKYTRQTFWWTDFLFQSVILLSTATLVTWNFLVNEKIQFFCYLDGLYESVMLLSSSHLLYFLKKKHSHL